MNPLIACCGLDCEACDARIATITNDNALREKTAALWSKLNGVTITPDMMKAAAQRAQKRPSATASALSITASGRNAWRPAPTVHRWTAARRWSALLQIPRPLWKI